MILDSTAVHGRRPFTRVDSALLLELARTDRIRLVVPDVVLHELARQWAKELANASCSLEAAQTEVNGILADADVPAVSAAAAPPLDRTVFYDAAVAMLTSKGVEIVPCPDISVADLLERDLAERKPFASSGKGFRDALIWESVKTVVTRLSPTTPVLFVTNNADDFCVSRKDRTLHPDLRAELTGPEGFEVVPFLRALLEHAAIKPLANLLRVLTETFTIDHVTGLTAMVLRDLEGAVPEPDFDSFDDVPYTSPFSTPLRDAVFDQILPDPGTIAFEVYRTGDEGEMTLAVRIDADCSLEGFIDRSAWSPDGYGYYEDWSRNVLRVRERPRRARFMLSGTFTETTIEHLELSVDDVEEVTLLTPLAGS
ncbi:PIN domain-containing protein [Microbacterium horticulturae]|uniref:PIN domain-containing protein n=1 Tax=Microbacterium horticulturae TaxID=3028316 RepID=A0ABY8BWU3_9MICO|nr:PIN domain-containing protein [Microbacterium sp. KACC 23027]WEG08631.1 PIN domain-containing protein [Microbacterium sp. KACC 23027]